MRTYVRYGPSPPTSSCTPTRPSVSWTARRRRRSSPSRPRRSGTPAMALTDHDGLSGSLAFAHAAKEAGVRPITGAELTLDRWGAPDAAGRDRGRVRQPLPADHTRPRRHPPSARSAADPPAARSRAPGHPRHRARVPDRLRPPRRDPRLVAADRARDAEAAARHLVQTFGPGNVYVELQQPRTGAIGPWCAT